MYLYIIKNKVGKLYIGISENIENRIKDHNRNRGAAFTKNYHNFELVYSELHPNLLSARKREVQIKKWNRNIKLALISGNIDLLKKFSKSKKV